jgi:molecular chaperone GrpE (heat shock protein)
MKNEEVLKDIVEEVFDVKITERNRRVNLVNARMVYSKILKESGYRDGEIADVLKKDRTTIIHYKQHCDVFMSQDEDMMKKYIECKNRYNNLIPERMSSRTYDLEKTIINLTNKIDSLILERNNIKKIERKYARLQEIIDLIDERTPERMEKEIKRKINQMFNDLWDT